MNPVLQIFAAGAGTLGFCILFHLRPSLWFQAAFGGILAWIVYSFVLEETRNVALSSFAATTLSSLYAEALARRFSVPATLFTLPAALPLIPGGPLYYTMQAVVKGQAENAWHFGILTLQFALGIAGGIIIASALGLVLQNLRRGNVRFRRGKRTEKREGIA